MKRTTFTFYALVLFLGLGGFLGCRQLDGSSRTGNYSIKGTVLDKDKNPLSGVVISVMGGGIGSVETDSSGNYELSGLGKNTCQVIAKKASYIFVPDFKSSGSLNYGSGLNVGSSAVNGVVSGVDFIAVPAGSLTISDIQGSGAKSPLTGETVYGITGVVTMISNKAANWNYNNSNVEGEDIAQYVGNDGFYLEALPYDKDFTGTKSNAIFVNTHDESFTDSKWKSGIPTDLQAGDVVTVSGVVAESRILDRFGSSTATLSRTEINAETVIRVEENGTYKTAPYPDGILITYSQAKAEQWKQDRKYTYEGNEYPGEARVMVGDVDSAAPMDEAIKVLETMECSVIYIENPLVIAGTYYNTTGVLADGGYKADGSRFRTFNETWMTNVVDKDDYNEELLFVDYSAFDYKAFQQSLSQTGDTLVDSTGAKVFRGVMDYMTGIYIARPLNRESDMYVHSTPKNFVTSYYTTYDGSDRTLTTYFGQTVPSQKWGFSNDTSWYTKLDNSAFGTVSKTNVTNGMQSQANTSSTSSENGRYVRQWRTGTSDSSSFNAGSVFTPNWASESSAKTGNTNEKSLTVGAFNLENYENQGSDNEKCKQVALTIKNNMLYPDVVVIVEMGDDAKTSSLYTNQDNEYAPRDGIVTAVRNFSTISDAIVANGGPRYEFRCIDPKERDSGGKSGVNIRNGFLYNTQRVEFVDNGLVSNTYANTHIVQSYDSSGKPKYDDIGDIKDESEWPVQTKDNDPAGWALADARTYPFKGEDGKPHLSQSPAYIESSYFARSRRPLIGEFKIKDSSGNTTEENFFVVACHLSSKRGDYPLYGSVQPPLLLSEVKRNGQAATINKFVQEILDIDEDAKIVVAGDMNDFAYSNPMQVLTGAVNRNQILYSLTEEFMPKNERFSYVYNGNYQQIDHVYVSKSLYDKALAEVGGKEAAQTSGDWKKVCFIPHIDSMFTRNNHYNLSDHDPDLIRIPGVFQ